MRRWLFICSKNRWRSPTAEQIFSDGYGVETDSAGLAYDAEVRLSEEQIEWADLILVMEVFHRRKLSQKFGRVLAHKKVVVLGIPDHYQYMDEQLVELLKERCAPYLR